jgi:2-oxoglutarate dehydrogenase complex dihydrolipoamide succinyltransferase (E2) component
MKIEIVMPKMGESITEGTIIKWHKQKGDHVNKEDIIYEISTDKVDTEIPCPETGILTEIYIKENETVEVGTVVGIIETDFNVEEEGKENGQDQEHEQEHEEDYERKTTDNLGIRKDSNKFFSPLVLSIARENNIDLSELEKIKGSGRGGRITKNDVLKYLEKTQTRVDDSRETPQTKPAEGKNIKIIQVDINRKKIMNHMIESRDKAVHVSQVIEVDMSKIHNLINQKRDNFFQKEGIKLTYMPFISYAVIKALKEFPLMNSSIDGDNIVMKNYINLGIAVAIEPNGLIVPNIKNADEKSLFGLAKAISDLGTRARTKKLVPDDVSDGTFSITNYGVFGSLFGTPIINQPEVGILGVGAVTKKPVVVENDGVESIAIKPMIYFSLSHDHRLVDGMLGGKFISSIKKSLEEFDTNII